ncbi:phage SPO1 DNA polymerase-related protein [Haladaptatus paucihalophilus DX253]|uniref:Type-4 uracil-DNA glycosylase n=1 Tax=Haladaptatus paucihalophilus DX253 TaxID=797209 RepID=E7QNC0_HALPU|nr:uracil-DNA glycosylase [Haladaptatus paucihalophilus]EFW93915.1 phage SPO1 DNA polymerase-related protein [Haladaptatus paucihalophilus DX253]SHK66952.1 DNA polymerase [Haladaptatus paucihalophilus DX253]
MGTMEGLDVTDCTRCPALVECRSQIVNGVGPEDADVLFIGEAPGAREDERGEPFVGRSGSVLDEKLRDRGLSRADVRITNCVRCRPPENRDPTTEELGNCREYLEREIELVDPDVIVTLGKVPSQHVLDRDVAVTNEAGSIEAVELGGTKRDVLVCLHPAATLYDRSQESTFESALDKAATMAGANGGQSNLGDF